MEPSYPLAEAGDELLGCAQVGQSGQCLTEHDDRSDTEVELQKPAIIVPWLIGFWQDSSQLMANCPALRSCHDAHDGRSR
jgi:hypothetical protein